MVRSDTYHRIAASCSAAECTCTEPRPTITDSDGTILDWSDLSTVPYSLDDSPEQEPPVPDLLETGSEKSLADADNDEEAADDRPTVNPTPKTPDEGSGDDEPCGRGPR